MTDRIAARAVTAFLCFVLVSPAGAQNPAPAPSDRTPQIQYSPGFKGAYRPGSVSEADFRSSPRLDSLLKDGRIQLSLDDAITLALENNLDIELERYGVDMAQTDTLRAQGGGTLRGVPLTVNEAPNGVGGPGGPLINNAATGALAQTNASLNANDAQFTSQSATNLSVTGTFPFANGPVIPGFDPALSGGFLAQHISTPEASLSTTGTTSLAQSNGSGNFGFSQGFSTGATVTAAFQNQFSNQNAIHNIFNPQYNTSLGFTITQPLMRGSGKEVNQRFIRIAKNSEKISDYVFQQQVISTVSGVMRLYYDLAALAEDLRVKQNTLATAQRLYDDNQSKVEQGTLAPIELTRAQAQVAAARQDLANSDGFLREQELIIKNFLSRDLVTNPAVRAARIVPTDPVTVDPLPTEDVDALIASALQNRPELQAAKLQVTNSELSLKGTRNSLLPQIDLVGSATDSGLSGPVNTSQVPPIPAAGSQVGLGGGYGASLGEIFRRDFPTYSVGLNVTLPLRNRQAQADVVRDELQLRQTQVRTRQIEKQIRLDVEDALVALQRTRAAYEAAVETRRLQEQSLEIEQERFGVGLSTNFLVIQYENYVAQARSSEVAARGAYAKARTQFERAMGQVLTRHNVSIGDAMKGQGRAK